PKLARRYVPLVAVGVALVLSHVRVPSATTRSNRTVASGAGAVQGGAAAGSGSSQPGAAGTGGTVANAGGATGGPAGQGGGRQLAVPTGITPPAAAGSAGLTRSGVQCGPGVRQVPWSVYATTCVP